jgi:hypothetical protein
MMRDIPNRTFRKSFPKANFSKIKLIGQFNKGFLIGVLANREVFILD